MTKDTSDSAARSAKIREVTFPDSVYESYKRPLHEVLRESSVREPEERKKR